VAIGGLLGGFLIKNSEKTNEHISKKIRKTMKKKTFLTIAKKKILPPMLRMNGQRPQMKGHVEKKKSGRATNLENLNVF
jgi:hypothetical protein